MPRSIEEKFTAGETEVDFTVHWRVDDYVVEFAAYEIVTARTIDEWGNVDTRPAYDQFDFHSFREHIHAKMTQSESLQLDLCALCRNLGLSDDRVPIDYLPALLDGTEKLVGGSCREELLGFAVQCLSTRQQCDTQP